MKQRKRTLVYDSKFLKVYEDEVELKDGSIITDYTTVQKPNISVIVATDTYDNLIVMKEFKYAKGECLYALPAGHVKKDENPCVTALRELQEETGYTAKDASLIGTLYEYPTKDLHTVYVIRVTNAEESMNIALEKTEESDVFLFTPGQVQSMIKSNQIKVSTTIAALHMCGY